MIFSCINVQALSYSLIPFIKYLWSTSFVPDTWHVSVVVISHEYHVLRVTFCLVEEAASEEAKGNIASFGSSYQGGTSPRGSWGS